MAGLLSVSYFLISLLFGIVFFLLWARIILRYFKVSAVHPIVENIFRLTNPLLLPLENKVYTKRRHPQYDWLGMLLLFLLELVKFVLLSVLMLHKPLPVLYLLLFAVCDMFIQLCNFFFYLLLVRMVFSWLDSKWHNHPAALLVKHLTNPLVRIGHKIIPNISGFDFAPFLMIIILKVITLFISANLPYGLV